MTTDDFLRRQIIPLAYRQLPAGELFARVADNDPEAFVALVCLKYPLVEGVCRQVLGPAGAVEDVALEAFVQLWRQRARVRDADKVDGWLTRTAQNLARKLLRDQARGRAAGQAWRQRINGASASPDRVAMQVEMVRRVRLAVSEQSDGDQRILHVSEHAGGDAQAAASLGLPVSTYRVRLHRARQRLRDLLKKYGVAPAAGAVGLMGGLRDRAISAVASRWATGLGRAQLAGLTACVTGLVAVTVWAARSNVPADPPGPRTRPVSRAPVAASPAEESLQARNVRIVRDDLAGQLRDLVQRFYPADNPLQVAGVRAFGAEVEVEFEAAHPPPPESGLAARLRGRYCTWRRRLVVQGQPAGQSHWHRMKQHRPAAVSVPVAVVGWLDVPLGQAEYAAAERLLDRLPRDPRAEAEHLRFLFGPPGPELFLPSVQALSADAGWLCVMDGDHGLFVRGPAGGWQWAGECPGWNSVVAEGRVYCSGHAVIRSRPLMDPTAAWEVVCAEAPVGTGEHANALCVAGGRLYQVVHPHGLWHRPLADRTAVWVREQAPIHSDVLAATADRLFARNARQLLTRPTADPSAPWAPAAQWPEGCTYLTVDGDRLLTCGGPGSVYARPLAAGPEVDWEVVGRVHDPRDGSPR